MALSRTGNLYELLRETGDGSEGKKRKDDKKTEASTKVAAPKKTESAAAPKSVPAKATPKSTDVKPKQDKAVGQATKPSTTERKPRSDNTSSRGGENRPKGEVRPREDRREKGERNRTDQVREDKGFVQTTKRVYERRSGTGRPIGENKKGGAGKGNWGKPGSEDEALADVDQASQPADDVQKNEETKESEPAVPKQLTPEELEAIKEREKEERMLTLEEYRKKQEEERAKIPLPEIRKAGEGTNEKKWANYQKLEKEEEQLFSAAPKKKGTGAATSSPSTKKNVVPVNEVLHVKERKPERSGRDSRGGRGGSGAGGRGGALKTGGGRGKAEEFSLNAQAFPALTEKVKA